MTATAEATHLATVEMTEATTHLAKVAARSDRRRELQIRAFIQHASNLIGEEGINDSILNLFGGELGSIPETPGHTQRLLNLHFENMAAQSLQPSPLQMRVTPKQIRSQRTKFTHVPHVEAIVLKKLLGVSAYPNAEESNVRV